MEPLKKENYLNEYWSVPMGTEYLPRPIQDESRSTSSVSEQLLENFKISREYRHAFVEEKTRTGIAAQIKAIREERSLKQPEFAKAMSKSQSWVSRLEDPNQPPPTIPSLLAVAEAFDVDLEIRFGRFSELLRRLDTITPESLEVPSFEEELNGGAFQKVGVTGWMAPYVWAAHIPLPAAQYTTPATLDYMMPHLACAPERRSAVGYYTAPPPKKQLNLVDVGWYINNRSPKWDDMEFYGEPKRA
jgi:transcriptional regulator with XRE-family HTH domain